MTDSFCDANISGVGIGLRSPHLNQILNELPSIPWLEILTDNYFNQSKELLEKLAKLRQHYPMTMHSVAMSLGSSDPLNFDYLKQIKALINIIKPAWISDHLCWCSIDKHYLPDLFPLPFTEKAADHVAARIMQVQDFLGEQILIENLSSYLRFKQAPMTEWQFLSYIATKADCYILLDINNIYVSSENHNFSPIEYLQGLPKAKVRQIHLAGFEDKGTHLLDTHSAPVHPPVWSLYAQAVEVFGKIPTLIEWDNNIPPLATLLQEVNKAREIMVEPCS